MLQNDITQKSQRPYHGDFLGEQTFFSIENHFISAYHISLVNVQTNYCNNNLLILDVKQLNKIMKLYYFYTSKHCGMARVKSRCIMGCPGLKNSYREKGLFLGYPRPLVILHNPKSNIWRIFNNHSWNISETF